MKPSDAPAFPRGVVYVKAYHADKGYVQYERWAYDAWLKGELEAGLARDLDESEHIRAHR